MKRLIGTAVGFFMMLGLTGAANAQVTFSSPGAFSVTASPVYASPVTYSVIQFSAPSFTQPSPTTVIFQNPTSSVPTSSNSVFTMPTFYNPTISGSGGRTHSQVAAPAKPVTAVGSNARRSRDLFNNSLASVAN